MASDDRAENLPPIGSFSVVAVSDGFRLFELSEIPTSLIVYLEVPNGFLKLASGQVIQPRESLFF